MALMNWRLSGYGALHESPGAHRLRFGCRGKAALDEIVADGGSPANHLRKQVRRHASFTESSKTGSTENVFAATRNLQPVPPVQRAMGQRIALDVEHEPFVQKDLIAILRREHLKAVKAEEVPGI
jgi:hypothetical protein